jgi:hypothetical protein
MYPYDMDALLPAEVNINIFGKSMGITPDSLHFKTTYNI